MRTRLQVLALKIGRVSWLVLVLLEGLKFRGILKLLFESWIESENYGLRCSVSFGALLWVVHYL